MTPKHFLSIESLSGDDLRHLISSAETFKRERGRHGKPLEGQTWAMMFSKSSTRTRVSFEIAVHEMGGNVIFLNKNDTQLGRGEPIEDTARVIGRMAHGAIIRTYDQADVETFAEFSKLPTINALTDQEHPCQIIGDLLTIKEHLGNYEGAIVSFLGDGDCNVARSWMWAAERLDFKLRIVAPKEFQPPEEFLKRFEAGHIEVTDDLQAGVLASDVIYTDVWVSMGREDESADRLKKLAPYQVNSELVDRASPDAMVLHCMPAYREKEITASVFEDHATAIFDQAENRLHSQKAILRWALS